jgi:cyanate permease
LIWLFIVPDSIMPTVAKKHTPIMESLRHITQLRELWIIGIGALVFWGCYRGFIGYLPTYLRNVGWTATDADNTLSLLYLSSLILALPLSLLSDRFNNRKFFMVASLLLMGLGGVMLGLGNLALVTMSVVLVGATFSPFGHFFWSFGNFKLLNLMRLCDSLNFGQSWLLNCYPIHK